MSARRLEKQSSYFRAGRVRCGRTRGNRRVDISCAVNLSAMYDRARIHVEGGKGGNGVVSFRREAHVPKGGPDGGDGGRGGDVVLVCDASLRDLAGLRRQAHFRGRRGGHGKGKDRHGARGDDAELRVPPGTEATALDGGVIDLVTRRAAGGAGARRPRRAREPPLRQLDPAGAAICRARRRGRIGMGRAAPEAACRRRPRRAAERGQVIAARPPHTRRAQGRRLPLHNARAGARNDRGR